MELRAEADIHFALGYAHDTMVVAMSTSPDNVLGSIKRAGIDQIGLVCEFEASAMGEVVEWTPRKLARAALREAIPKMVLGKEPPVQFLMWLFVVPESVSLLHCYGSIEKSNGSLDALFHFRLLEKDSFSRGLGKQMGYIPPIPEQRMVELDSLIQQVGAGGALWFGSTHVTELGQPPKTLLMNSGTRISRVARRSRLLFVLPLAGRPHQVWTMSSHPEGCEAFANLDAEENPSVFPVELLAEEIPGENLRLDVHKLDNAMEVLVGGFDGFPEILSKVDPQYRITEETPIKLATILNEHCFPLGVLVLSAKSFWTAHPIEVEVEMADGAE